MLRRRDLGRGAHTLAAAAAGPLSVSGLYRGGGRAAACRLNVVVAHLAGPHCAVPSSRAGWPDGLRLLSTSSSSAAAPPCDSGGGRLLAGKTALVTGSTQGIGLGIARELCRNGASLVINGFGDPKEIEKTRASLQAINNQPVHYINADLCKPQEIEHLIAQSIQKLGKLDIVVNNAGIQYLSPIEDFPVEKWQMIIDLNLSSVFHTMRLTLPHMRQRSYGRIINISSVHGIVASKHKAAYVAAKHAVVGLTKVAALEYAGSGVTCNCINPGWVLTDLVQKQIEAKASDLKVSVEEAKNILLSEKQPSLSFATPEQLGQLAVFLCSEAADQITGINIPVDGGWTAQ